MLNPLKFISKLIKSSNQKELDRISVIVTKINSLEENINKLEKRYPNGFEIIRSENRADGDI